MPQEVVETMNLRGIDEVGIVPLKDDCSGYEGLVKTLKTVCEVHVEWTQSISDIAVGRNVSYDEVKSPLVGKGTIIFDGLSRAEQVMLFDCKTLASGGISFGEMFSKRKWFGVYAKQSNGELIAKLDLLKVRFTASPKFDAKSITKEDSDPIRIECPIECFPVNELLSDGKYKAHSYICYNSVDDLAKWATVKDAVIFPKTTEAVV